MAKFNIYEMVNEKILTMLDNGIIPWQKPWHGTSKGAISRATGKPYSLLNQFLMPEGEYVTFNACKKEGGKVNKGAKSYPVIFWKIYKKEEIKDGEKVEVSIPVLRYYNVFNISDTTLEPKYTNDNVKVAEPSEYADKILNNYWKAECIKVNNDTLSDRACYSPISDRIRLPKMEQFTETAEYYSTAFHESMHSTGHKNRLNRGLEKAVAFGDEDYSKEELVAEIGASALVNISGLETASSLRNNVAYIQGWRNAIARDNRLVVNATSKAEKGVNLIMSYTEE